MSDQLTAVELENVNLKEQMQQNSLGVQALIAQIEAHKQFIQDLLNNVLSLRTNLNLFEKQQKLSNGQIEALNKKLLDAEAKIVDNEKLIESLIDVPVKLEEVDAA